MAVIHRLAITTNALRYFVHIAYKGSRYCGWQRQPNKISVQQTLESTLSRILKIPVPVFGCGRTDAGVHASQFFFHMDITNPWDFDLLFRCNHILPDDISVFDIIPMQGLPHARFDATLRIYDYFIHTSKDPFLSSGSTLYLREKLNLDEMKKAVKLLPRYNDYRAYCKSPDKNEHTICHVSSAGLYISRGGNRLRFRISSNRFLGRMIRILVHKLIEIGEGTLSVDEFESHLISRQTPTLILPAHPEGLYLSKVTYPYLDLETKAAFSEGVEANEYWIHL